MKVNRIIALRLMLSVAVIIGLQVAVKNQVQKVRQELLAGMSSKTSGNKTSSWTWIDFCGRRLLRWVAGTT
jgi:hypothetical protein